jgi:hypothetical protein
MRLPSANRDSDHLVLGLTQIVRLVFIPAGLGALDEGVVAATLF